MSGDTKMRVLILTVTAGNGHNACAKAMAKQLAEGGAEVKIIDYFTTWSTPRERWTVDDGYNLACTYALRVYNACYRMQKRLPPERRYSKKMLAQKLGLCVAEELLQVIDDFRPDVIYCTHFYPAIAICDMRLIMDIPAKLYLTTFDFNLCPFWEAAAGVDYLNLSTYDIEAECFRRGYKKEQLLYCGIPVDSKFLQPADKAASRGKLGLNADMFTIMIMFGGGQWSGGRKIFRQVMRALEKAPSPAQIIMINGRNEKDRRKLESALVDGTYKGHRIVNVGFTDEIETYMAASDIIVTKLGGTGATECINMLLPIVAAERLLPQQEADNAVYLREKGAALTYRNTGELGRHIVRLMTDKEFYEGMRAAQAELRLGGVQELADHILSQPKAVYKQGTLCRPDLKKAVYAAMDMEDKKARDGLRKKIKNKK